MNRDEVLAEIAAAKAMSLDVDLRGADLRGVDLSGLGLRGADLRDANLTGAKLKKTDLFGARLSGARLTKANLTGAKLHYANFFEANLTKANLTKANLAFANLAFANLDGADLTGTSLSLTKCAFANLANMKGQPSAWPRDFAPPDLHIPKEHFTVRAPKSKEFRAWFGKSRATQKSGAPVLLYHGTPSGGFTAFDLAKADAHHPGFYFTNDLAVANTYFGIAGDIEDPTPSLDGTHPATNWGAYRVWVRLENPFVFDAEGANWNRMQTPEYPSLRKTYEIAHAAKRDGYDGCIFRNVRDSGGKTGYGKPADVYVIFSPTQIKSALFNDGSFSLTDPDIRKNPRRTSKRKTSKRKTSKRKTSRRRR